LINEDHKVLNIGDETAHIIKRKVEIDVTLVVTIQEFHDNGDGNDRQEDDTDDDGNDNSVLGYGSKFFQEANFRVINFENIFFEDIVH